MTAGRTGFVLFIVLWTLSECVLSAFGYLSLRPATRRAVEFDRRYRTSRPDIYHINGMTTRRDCSFILTSFSLAAGKDQVVASDETASRFGLNSYVLTQAALIGVGTGWSVALFKLTIDAVKRSCYGASIFTESKAFRPLIPTLGGCAVGLLSLLGQFPPGMKGMIKQVDEELAPLKSNEDQAGSPFGFLRKTMAAVFTLGTGCSLGPEGPSVEIGMSMSRMVLNIFPLEFLFGRSESRIQVLQQKRLLLTCGAAAGVSAGFNAPLSGVFFALEIVQAAFPPMSFENQEESLEQESLTSPSRNIGAILLSSVISALIARALLGTHLHLILNGYQLRTPLAELPLYLLLGAISGIAAFLFHRTVVLSDSFFKGETMSSLPKGFRPVLGGFLCGLVGLFFPQILFFGYETLNSLLSNCSLPNQLLASLLVVKTLITGFSAGSGLVGGLFAPSLFLGAMLGALFHNVMSSLFHSNSGTALLGAVSFQLADIPAYAMVGSGCVLAGMFKAPLTASLLLFELTRDYDVILPLMASAGVAAVVSDVVGSTFMEKTRGS